MRKYSITSSDGYNPCVSRLSMTLLLLQVVKAHILDPFSTCTESDDEIRWEAMIETTKYGNLSYKNNYTVGQYSGSPWREPGFEFKTSMCILAILSERKSTILPTLAWLARILRCTGSDSPRSISFLTAKDTARSVSGAIVNKSSRYAPRICRSTREQHEQCKTRCILSDHARFVQRT